MYHFKSDDRSNQREREEQAPEGGWLFKHEDANQHSSYRTDACPYGISCANRNFLNCFGEKHHAQNVEHDKRNVPPRGAHPFCKVGFA